MLRSMLVVAILAVAVSVPGRKRPNGGTPTVGPTVRTGPGPRCRIEYKTEYNTVYERQCTNHYQQSCSITGYREECRTDVDVEDCFEPDFEPDFESGNITNYKLKCKNGNCKLFPLHTPRKRSPRKQNAL